MQNQTKPFQTLESESDTRLNTSQRLKGSNQSSLDSMVVIIEVRTNFLMNSFF